MPYRVKEYMYLLQGAYSLKFETRKMTRGGGGAHGDGEKWESMGVHFSDMYMGLIPVGEGKRGLCKKFSSFSWAVPLQ